MQSCIFQGQISHRRFQPLRHDFRYNIRMLYVDLGELPELFDRFWLWSARSPAPAWFRRADHHGDAHVPLDRTIRDLVADRTGIRPEGPIRLLTHFRYFGYCFNPLSIYYCYSPAGELESVVLEVSNTPWGEMHTYVLTRGTPIANGGFRFNFPKSFHVSPFLPMDMEYRCRLAPPGPRLAFALENWRQGARCFDAHLNFRQEPISSRSLARLLASDPLATLRVTALIYWQAWRLWRKRAPVYDHATAGTAPGS